jgi:large subunit ribosomal protein L35
MPSRFERVVCLWVRPFNKRNSEMPKMKTKSSAKKRFRLTGSGKVRANYACKSHFLRRRSQSMKRKARGTLVLSAADARIVKSYMPYA